jgi:D-beta-D-heptose 7-phosphate kinase / D-beta-D-heptose 1-phosphate adenosyltransferase
MSDNGGRPDGASSLQHLLEARASWRQDGAMVVWTNGCFDILHPGHVRFLTQARALGDVLLVGINGDDSVRRLKGASRPFIPLSGRITMLAGLRSVDHVVVLSGDTPAREVEVLRPDVCCKDGEYTVLPLPERELVEGYGGRMALLPRDTTWSTTSLASQVTAQVAGQFAAEPSRGPGQ